MKLVCLLGFLCLVAAGSNKKRINEEDYYKRSKHKKTRIAGGTEAYIQDMPFMASFIKKGPSYQSGLDRLICTAVIIQPFWVLMTATPLVDVNASDSSCKAPLSSVKSMTAKKDGHIKILIGFLAQPSHTLCDEQSTILAQYNTSDSKITLHNFLKSGLYVIRSNTAFFDGSTDMYRDHVIVEWYAQHLYEDSDNNITRRVLAIGANLGLVKVKTEFNGEYEKPINIVSRNYQYKVSSKAIQAGWGATEASHGHPSIRLMVANTRLTDYEKCRRFFRYYFIEPDVQIVTRDMVCTFEHGKRPCIGDSGGPLIQGGRLIAILGYDKPCFLTNFPDINTKIAKFVGWIEDTVFNVTKRKVRPNRYRTGKIIF